jgi:hypothetical protein
VGEGVVRRATDEGFRRHPDRIMGFASTNAGVATIGDGWETNMTMPPVQ